MIDAEGYRANVGIIIAHSSGRVFWAKRTQQDSSWQFPQGGIDGDETPVAAMYRELYEEVGLNQDQVTLLAETRGWLRYQIPDHLIRKRQQPRCIGQKQKWFLLRLDSDIDAIRFDCGDKAEFCDWQWVSYWYPLSEVVNFKREVYRKALKELAPVFQKTFENSC